MDEQPNVDQFENQSNTQEEDDDESTVDEFEPKLKYVRMSNDIKNILTNDSASCVAVHTKFVCVGTAWGLIHLFDHQGNTVRNKELRAHSVAVNQISIDSNGDYIASCSDDGKVFVFGLYSSDNNHDMNIGMLVRSIAIDPNYSKSGSGRRFITGDERLVLHEKTLFSRARPTILADASQEGGVKTMKWSPGGGEFLAWASHVGFRVYDLTARASLGLVKWAHRPQVDMKCHMCWKDGYTLIVGWNETVWVCHIEKRTTITPLDASIYVVHPVSTFETDFLLCGVGPLAENLVLFGCSPRSSSNIVQDRQSSASSNSLQDRSSVSSSSTVQDRPSIHVVFPEADDFTDIAMDCLSLRGYQLYQPNEYSLECLVEEGSFVIVSPKDIVIAYPCDDDDRIDWLLSYSKFESALEAVTEARKPLARHSLLSVGRKYIDHLLSEEEFVHAALVAHKIIGNDKNLWKDELAKFARVNQLRVVAEYLPYNSEDSLSPIVYEMVLNEFLKNDPEGLRTTIRKWSTPGLFNVPSVINGILDDAINAEQNAKPILLESLAILYSYSGQHDKALAMYIKIQNKGVFDLIRTRKLYTTAQNMPKELMSLDTGKAIAVFMESKTIDKDLIVSKLQSNSFYLYLYLDALERRDPKSCQKYHSQLMGLYADFEREKLLPLLKKSDHVPIQEALDMCQRRGFHSETVYLLARIGNTQEALSLIMKSGDIEKAIEFCKEYDDLDLWEDLINYSLARPEFIEVLLKKIATYVDPRILVQRIEPNVEIPKLKPSLVKMLRDYHLQVAVQEGTNSIIAADYFNLHERVVAIQQRGTLIGDEHFCGKCHRKIVLKNIKEEGLISDLKLFHCSHVFHDTCLSIDSETCRICTTQKIRIPF